MAVTKIEESDFKKVAVESKKKVLGPIIDSLSEEVEDYEFYKLNVDDAEEVSREYGIMSIPTLLVFNNGELVDKSVGLLPKEEIKKLLK